MARMIRRYINKFFGTPFRAVGSLIVLAALVILVLELTNVTHIFHKLPASKVVVTAGRPVGLSTPVTSQPVQKKSSSSSSSAASQGGATDTNGSTASTSSPNQWVTSQSGVITVKEPTANARLQDGDSIVGTAKVSQVSYRLKDNKVGVIAQGTLTVTNGNFSGVLHFSPQGTGGQLDIFTTDSQGVEYNEVQINVSF